MVHVASSNVWLGVVVFIHEASCSDGALSLYLYHLCSHSITVISIPSYWLVCNPISILVLNIQNPMACSNGFDGQCHNTFFFRSQIIKCNRAREKFLWMSNPFFCSGNVSITMCLGLDKPSCHIVCGFAKFVNFNAK